MASLVLKCAYENIALLISRNIDHSTQSMRDDMGKGGELGMVWEGLRVWISFMNTPKKDDAFWMKIVFLWMTEHFLAQARQWEPTDWGRWARQKSQKTQILTFVDFVQAVK